MQDLAKITPLISLNPLDGRYRQATAPLTNYFSEAALNRARVKVEVEWLIFLTNRRIIPDLSPLTAADCEYLREIAENFGASDIAELKTIEAETRHDVKAVEYYLKRRLTQSESLPNASSLPQLGELVHILCTSEDINNLAYALMMKAALKEVWLPAAQKFYAQLRELAITERDCPLLARTHGQTASPSTIGKEIAVFAYRLQRQLQRLAQVEYLGKFNGATGTYGAHSIALPQADWLALSRDFVTELGLTWNPLTTQIESHDWLSEIFAILTHFNRICHNLATDFWLYISLGYFRQKLSAQGSTGSSTMPHKVNPIRFENAEANMEISCALFDSLSATLVTSRWQRDLTDSTTLRNMGVAFGHSLLAIENLQRGVAGLEVNLARLTEDLEHAWEVLAEPIQQTMRIAAAAGTPGMQNPYEQLKELTRGHKVTASEMRNFIKNLDLPAAAEQRLLELSPATYTGLASRLVDFLPELAE